MPIPALRLRTANDKGFRPDGQFVLYWMVAFRRTHWNFALQHAADRAAALGKPLVVFEPLRTRYRWASDRLHRFIIAGMRDNQAALADQPVTYFPYVEPQPGAGTPLLHALAKHACTVISDDYPCFFLPHMVKAVADRLPVSLELVDSNGVMPMRAAERTFTVAHSYRRWMQKTIPEHLSTMPAVDPLAGRKLPRLESLPHAIIRRWPAANLPALLREGGLAKLPIDHAVGPGAVAGGPLAAARRLSSFLDETLSHYDEDRNHPDRHGSSGLSPYLHFGHISAHQVISDLLDHEAWNPAQLGPANGKNHGFWNTSTAAEGFLDQMLTWREMGFNLTSRHPDSYDRFESLPDWARRTLEEHADDPRPVVYSLDAFESAQTDDELWNAAQRQLVQDGVMHNYMRMLWGKKILHWTNHPREALQILIELNNKYALDGRDPNSYSGIFWTLGRYDRAWGPKRPIFGSVRYMTSDSARKKLQLKQYLERFRD